MTTLTAEEYEKVFEFMYEISKIAPFDVKTTEAMHYRRYVAQRQKAEHGAAPETANARGMVWRTAGVSDGKGFVFVSHTGEIYPSGFLPVSAGNVADRFAGARLPRFEFVPHSARYRAPGREVRRLRIPERSAAAPAPAPTPPQATTWPKIRAAYTSRRWRRHEGSSPGVFSTCGVSPSGLGPTGSWH